MSFTPEYRKDVIFEIMSTNKMHRHLVESCLGGCGVYRGQHQLLMFVVKNAGKSQKEIAKGLGVTTATVAVAIKKLEKEGYLKKAVDQTDNRFNQIVLTDKGNDMVIKSRQLFEQVDELMLEGFTVEELEGFKSVLERMKENLNKADVEKLSIR